jgi:hypothetical protein
MITKIGYVIVDTTVAGLRVNARAEITFMQPASTEDGHFIPAQSVTMMCFYRKDIDALVKQLQEAAFQLDDARGGAVST